MQLPITTFDAYSIRPSFLSVMGGVLVPCSRLLSMVSGFTWIVRFMMVWVELGGLALGWRDHSFMNAAVGSFSKHCAWFLGLKRLVRVTRDLVLGT